MGAVSAYIEWEVAVSEPNLDISGEALRQRRGVKWARYPPDVLPAWVADMDFPIAPPVQAALERLVEQQDYGYHARLGREGVPVAFAERMRDRFGWTVQPSHVQVVAEVVQAIRALMHVFSAPGDGVVVQTPIYPPFLNAVLANARTLVESRLRLVSGRYVADLDVLRATADERTRILLLCNPHNPTGRVFTRAELQALALLAEERDWLVISDEIHADLVYPGGTHIPFAMLSAAAAARTVTVTSATKAFNIAGLRCAVMHFGSEALQDRFQTALPPAILGPTNVMGEDATVAAWRAGQPWLEAVLGQLGRNRARVAAFLAAELPEVRHLAPEATYLSWLDCAALDLPDPPSRFFLKRAKVALGDGPQFGGDSEQCVRLNFATAPAILEEILSRMADAVAVARRENRGRGAD